MTPPEFSVLLLAWDDADPTVAVLGGAALPPTLPLVYRLAAQHPVLAVYPHLPAGESRVESAVNDLPIATAKPVTAASGAASATADAAPAGKVAAAAEAAPEALATAVDGPGVQVLPALALEKKVAVPAWRSRIVGLAELEPADAPAAEVPPVLAARSESLAASRLAPLPVPGRSQWPTGANAPTPAGQWQAPAAPYLGAGSDGFFPPPPASPQPLAAWQTPNAIATPGAGFRKSEGIRPTVSTATAALRPRQNPQAGDLNFDPDPELPAVQQPAVFQEITAEVGAGEAADTSAPEDDLVRDGPTAVAEALAVAPVVPASAAAAAQPAGPTVRSPQLDGLNFRMIQYARQAAQLVRGRSDFGVIYAPSWPAWLAAIEIRNSSGRPLVLYVASLALDLPNPAEHGYQLEMERMAMRRARLVLVPDEDLRRRLLALYEDATDKVRVVAADDETTVQKTLSEVAMG